MVDVYGTVAGFHAYVLERDLPDGHADNKVAAKLIVASEWIDARYGSLFPGQKTDRLQDRSWPRIGAFDDDGYAIDSNVVPTALEYATYEAVRRELNTPGILSSDYTPSKYLSASVSGAVAVVFRDFNTASESQIQLQIVTDLLKSVLTGSGGDDNILSGASFR